MKEAATKYSYQFARENYAMALLDPNLRSLKLPESLKKAVPKRQLHFLIGRFCAQKALEEIGCQDALSEIKIGKNGKPLWPPGYTGSITHVDGYASAEVGCADRYPGIGIDTEAVMTPILAHKIHHQIVSQKEVQACAEGCPDWSFETIATFCFSAKESVYKCLSPLMEKILGFSDIEIISVAAEKGYFQVRLPDDLLNAEMKNFNFLGQFKLEGRLVHTSVILTSSKKNGL